MAAITNNHELVVENHRDAGKTGRARRMSRPVRLRCRAWWWVHVAEQLSKPVDCTDPVISVGPVDLWLANSVTGPPLARTLVKPLRG